MRRTHVTKDLQSHSGGATMLIDHGNEFEDQLEKDIALPSLISATILECTYNFQTSKESNEVDPKERTKTPAGDKCE